MSDNKTIKGLNLLKQLLKCWTPRPGPFFVRVNLQPIISIISSQISHGYIGRSVPNKYSSYMHMFCGFNFLVCHIFFCRHFMSAWNSVLLISRFVSHLLPIFIFQLALNEIKAEILNVVNCNSFIRERKFPLHYKISTTVFSAVLVETLGSYMWHRYVLKLITLGFKMFC